MIVAHLEDSALGGRSMTPHLPGGVNVKGSRRPGAYARCRMALFLFTGTTPGHNDCVVVQCQSCQARFRVADDKVTDRGVRVRCTSCRTIFLVRKDGVAVAPSQASTGETMMGLPPVSLIPPARQAGPLPGVRLASTPPAQRPPPAARNGAQPRPASDHFGMAELTGEAEVSRPAPTPFPAAATRPSSPPPAQRSGPPAARAQPAPQRPAPPPDLGLDIEIDMSPAAPIQQSRPPAPAQRAPPPPSKQLPQALPIGKLVRPSKPAPTDEPAAPSIPPPPPPVFDEMDLEGDEARRPKPPVAEEPKAAAADRPDMRDPFAGMDLGGDEGGDNPPPLRPSDPALGKVPAQQPPDLETPARAPADGEGEHTGAPAPAEGEHAAEGQADPAGPRLSQRHLVSSVLTGLIGAGIALALALGSGALHDGALPRLLGLGGGDLVAITEASGLYDTASGKPVFFVRGRVENRGKGPAGPVRVVAVMVGESGATTARAETLAGVDATPEDVYALRSSAEADKLVKTLAQKRTGERNLPAGGSLPFFALFPDPPGAIQAQRIQVRVER